MLLNLYSDFLMAAVAAGWLLLRDNFVSAEYKDTNYLKMELNPAPVHLGFIIVGASPSAYPNLWAITTAGCFEMTQSTLSLKQELSGQRFIIYSLVNIGNGSI